MYAIVEISGKQYKVQEGDIVFVDRLEVEEGKEVTFDSRYKNTNLSLHGIPQTT